MTKPFKITAIRELTASDQTAFLAYAADWTGDTSPFTIDATSTYKTLTAADFPDYLSALLQEATTPKNPDYSTANHYFAFTENGQIAGQIDCRWQIEKGILLEWGGHIGYGTAPSFRGHGVASQMLAFALEKYRERGITRVMISAHEDNPASRTVIEKAGGQLENTVAADGGLVCRYWIELGDEK